MHPVRSAARSAATFLRCTLSALVLLVAATTLPSFPPFSAFAFAILATAGGVAVAHAFSRLKGATPAERSKASEIALYGSCGFGLLGLATAHAIQAPDRNLLIPALGSVPLLLLAWKARRDLDAGGLTDPESSIAGAKRRIRAARRQLDESIAARRGSDARPEGRD